MSQAVSSLGNDPLDEASATGGASPADTSQDCGCTGPADANEECGCDVPEAALVRCLPIINKRGLHARASAKFVQTVEQFDANVTVCRSGEAVGGTSIMGLMMLAAAPGTSVTVTATGAAPEVTTFR